MSSTSEQNKIDPPFENVENCEESKNEQAVALGGGVSFCFSGAACKPIPPFLLKIHDMLENDGADCSVISWRCNGSSFVITNPHSFSDNVLPMYFRHNNFQSFVTQLNSYGFRKISWEHWEYGHEYFRKGERHLLKNIKRRNQISRPSSLDDMQFFSLRVGGKEVEAMMNEHDHLRMEIEMLKDKQEALERKLASLKDQATMIKTEKGTKGIMEMVEGLLRKRKIEELGKSATPFVDQDDDNNNNNDNDHSCLANVAEFLSDHLKHGSFKIATFEDITNNTLISLEDMLDESSSSDWVEYLKDLSEKASHLKS